MAAQLTVNIQDPTGSYTQQVDPTFLASRHSLRPLDYAPANATAGGAYRLTQSTGTTVSISANGVLFSVAWRGTTLMVLHRVRVWGVVASTITTATPVDVAVYKFTNWSATGSSGTLLATAASKLRTSMNSSVLTTTAGGDIRIATTGALTAATKTNDPNPFAYGALAFVGADNKTAGSTASPVELYKADVMAGHPIVLATNEGLEFQEVTAGPTTGGIRFTFELEWFELSSY